MNNQNDLIFKIVFGVLGLIAIGIAYGTKPEPPAIAAPTQVVTTDATPPATTVVYGTALPNGATTSGAGAPGGMRPPGGMGSPGMGMPGMSRPGGMSGPAMSGPPRMSGMAGAGGAPQGVGR